MQELIIPDRTSGNHSAVAHASTLSAQFGDAQTAEEFSLNGGIAALWRHRLLFLTCFVLSFGAAAAIVLSLQPRYESEALLLIDPRETHITALQSVQDAPGGMSDLNFVHSEMQILDSDQFARQVVTDLHLQSNPEFSAKTSFLSGRLAALGHWLGIEQAPSAPKNNEQLINEAVRNYKDRFSSFNDGKSFIISAAFSASEPRLAQQILATHIALYLASQKAGKQQLIRKAEAWFSGELSQLSDKLLRAEAQQQAFRGSNHLLRSGGETISGRQLADVTSQLAVARSDLARKEARYNELRGLAGNSNAASTDSTVLSSTLIQQLREREALAAQQVAELSQRLGSQSPQLLAAKASLNDVRQSIAREIGRMATSAANDLAIAKANAQQLERSVGSLEQQLGTTSQAELSATQLERSTDTDRRLYDDLLARSKQIAIQREMQEPDAKIASEASLPLTPAFPRRGVLLAIAFSGAIVLSAAVALLADKLRRSPSLSLEEIETACGVSGLAVLPRVKLSRRRLQVALAPLSYLAAALQSLRNSIAYHSNDRLPKVIVFTSALPRDGKTTVALLFAKSLALTGRNVLLIDADLRRPGLSRLLQLPGREDIPGTPGKARNLVESVLTDRELGFDLLAGDRAWGDSGSLLSQETVRDLLNEARGLYDNVIIDTPPIAAVDDALPFASLADATVFVVRWGHTPHQVIRAALRRLRLAGANVAGAVLNATDPNKHRSGLRDLEAYRPPSGSYFLSRS